MSMNGREAAKLAAMIGVGAVVGAALGLLFAPQSGVETRRDVARYARRAQVQATRFSRAVKSGVTDIVERSKAIVQKKTDKPVVEAA